MSTSEHNQAADNVARVNTPPSPQKQSQQTATPQSPQKQQSSSNLMPPPQRAIPTLSNTRTTTTTSTSIVPVSGATVTAESWFETMKRSDIGQEAKNISELLTCAHLFRLPRDPGTGMQNSKHYTIRLIKDPSLYHWDNTNSTSVPTFYVDCDIDVSVSRRKAEASSLARSGYYDLTCKLRDFDPTIASVLSEVHKTLLSYMNDPTTDALKRMDPIYESKSGSYLLAGRIFERSSAKSSNTKSSDMRIQRLYRDTVSGSLKIASVDVSDRAYLEFRGSARIAFRPSVITVAGGYSKMVFNISSILMRDGSEVMPPGVNLTPNLESESSADASLRAIVNNLSREEVAAINKIKGVIRDLLIGGITAHDILAMFNQVATELQSNTVSGKSDRAARGSDDEYDSVSPMYTRSVTANRLLEESPDGDFEYSFLHPPGVKDAASKVDVGTARQLFQRR